MTTPLREAAAVILLRRRAPSGFEVFLVRRHRGASFFASASVFPGGATDPDEDARVCAARELFEEAGVLLAKQSEASSLGGDVMMTMGRSNQSLPGLRKRVLAGESATQLLQAQGMTWWTDVLVPWSHWITPSIEPKRFSARFFVAELPAGQKPSFDAVETIEEFWVSPDEGIARAGELSLPPPQLRTLHELAAFASVNDVLAAGKARADEPHPILPRRKQDADPPILLLPWDPEYASAGTGDAAPLTYAPTWATGPSRFVRDGNAWKHVTA